MRRTHIEPETEAKRVQRLYYIYKNIVDVRFACTGNGFSKARMRKCRKPLRRLWPGQSQGWTWNDFLKRNMGRRPRKGGWNSCRRNDISVFSCLDQRRHVADPSVGRLTRNHSHLHQRRVNTLLVLVSEFDHEGHEHDHDTAVSDAGIRKDDRYPSQRRILGV